MQFLIQLYKKSNIPTNDKVSTIYCRQYLKFNLRSTGSRDQIPVKVSAR